MAVCSLLGGCQFFDEEMCYMPGLAELYKSIYCMTDNSDCARFIVAEKLGIENVPKNLYPNMVSRANEIVAEGIGCAIPI